MFLVQTSKARRTRKFTYLVGFVLVISGALGAIGALLTLHLDVPPPKRD